MDLNNPNRFHLLRELGHSEFAVFFELNRQIAVTGQHTIAMSIRTLAKNCNVSARSVQRALTSLEDRKLIRMGDDVYPRRITILYDLTIRLRPEERELTLEKD